MIVLQKLTSTNLELAKQLMLVWQEDDGVEEVYVPSDTYILKLLARSDFHVYVAMKDQMVVGGVTGYELPMFYREKKELFVYEVGVSKYHRKEGIGKRLMEFVKQDCIENKISCFFLGTEPDNDPANALYRATKGRHEPVDWYTYDTE